MLDVMVNLVIAAAFVALALWWGQGLQARVMAEQHALNNGMSQAYVMLNSSIALANSQGIALR